MKSNRERIQELKINGYNISFENIFNLAFENYKKIALYAGLLFLVSAIFVGIFSTFLIAFTYGIENFQELIKPENLDPKKFSQEFIIKYILGVTLISALISPFFAGFIKMAYCADIDEEFHVSTAFEFYKFRYFKELFLATIFISFLSYGISTVLDSTGIPVLGLMGSLTISFLTILTVPLIIFSDFKAFEAINTSIILVLKHPLTLLALAAIAYLFSLTGFFIFLIGLFFTFPFMFSMNYAIYKSIVNFN